jgi:hypothetical protein
MTHYSYVDLKDVIDFEAGRYNENLRKVLAYLDPNGSDSYDNWIDEDSVYESNNNCCCSKEIKHTHGIKHKLTGDTLDIGSQCIFKFSGDIKMRSQRRLTKLKHPSKSYCKSCIVCLPDSYVDSYKSKGMVEFYHKTCLDNQFKSCVDCSLHIGYDCKCHLELNCEHVQYPGFYYTREQKKICIICSAFTSFGIKLDNIK